MKDYRSAMNTSAPTPAAPQASATPDTTPATAPAFVPEPAASAPARTLDLSIGGMTCASCSGRVERALGKVPCGVAGRQPRAGSRTAWESTAGDPVTLKAS